MVQMFQGDVSFTLHNKVVPHRFEVTVTDENKIVIWIEDRLSKKQWQTDALSTSAFVTEDNAIPKAKIADYAQRFAACLESTDASDKYERSLTTKGGEHVLILSLPLQWALVDLTLEYKFTMKEVPLERIDILGARVRDVEDKVSTFAEDRIRHLEQENEALKARIDEEVNRPTMVVQAKMAGQPTTNQTITWTVGSGNADDAVAFLPTGYIQFKKAGVHAIDIGLVHTSSANGVVFELKHAETTLAACYDSNYNGHYSTAPLRYVFEASVNDEIHVVYKGNSYAYAAGSYMVVTKMHTEELIPQDYITEQNAIPTADPHHYAERFAVCLSAKEDAAKYKRTLTSKGTERALLLTLPLQWAALEFSVTYAFTLEPVPLQQIDILGARVRDLEDKIATVDVAGLSDLVAAKVATAVADMDFKAENAKLREEMRALEQRVNDLTQAVRGGWD